MKHEREANQTNQLTLILIMNESEANAFTEMNY